MLCCVTTSAVSPALSLPRITSHSSPAVISIPASALPLLFFPSPLKYCSYCFADAQMLAPPPLLQYSSLPRIGTVSVVFNGGTLYPRCIIVVIASAKSGGRYRSRRASSSYSMASALAQTRPCLGCVQVLAAYEARRRQELRMEKGERRGRAAEAYSHSTMMR